MRPADCAPLNPLDVAALVEAALREDLGRAGDITTNALLSASQKAEARLVARRDGVVAGMALAEAAFRTLEPGFRFEPQVADGETVAPGQELGKLWGSARTLLAGERVALNFLCHLSGIATLTRAYVDRIQGTAAKMACTRKTIPGLRAAQKYAVRAGGGSNHRFGLDDAVLIKDNHIALAGGVVPAITRARAAVGHLVKIEVEVDTLAQLDEALSVPVDVVMLDNFALEDLRKAVARAGRAVVLEASGGVTLDTVRAIAETGVDIISVGALTHSAPQLDIGLDIP